MVLKLHSADNGGFRSRSQCYSAAENGDWRSRCA
jgi:hypothetical protein